MNEVTNDIVVIASRQAFILRSIAVFVFIYGCFLVAKQFNRGKLQPLRWRLFSVIAVNGLSNIPILWIHWQRMWGRNVSVSFSAFASNSNSLAMLVTAALIISVIKFRIKE